MSHPTWSSCKIKLCDLQQQQQQSHHHRISTVAKMKKMVEETKKKEIKTERGKWSKDDKNCHVFQMDRFICEWDACIQVFCLEIQRQKGRWKKDMNRNQFLKSVSRSMIMNSYDQAHSVLSHKECVAFVKTSFSLIYLCRL